MVDKSSKLVDFGVDIPDLTENEAYALAKHASVVTPLGFEPEVIDGSEWFVLRVAYPIATYLSQVLLVENPHSTLGDEIKHWCEHVAFRDIIPSTQEALSLFSRAASPHWSISFIEMEEDVAQRVEKIMLNAVTLLHSRKIEISYGTTEFSVLLDKESVELVVEALKKDTSSPTLRDALLEGFNMWLQQAAPL